MKIVLNKDYRLPVDIKNGTLASLNHINGILHLVAYTGVAQIHQPLTEFATITDLDRNALPFSFQVDFASLMNPDGGELEIIFYPNAISVNQKHFSRICKRNDIQITPSQLIQPQSLSQKDIKTLTRLMNSKSSIGTLCALMKIPTPPIEIFKNRASISLPNLSMDTAIDIDLAVSLQIKDIKKIEEVTEILIDDSFISVNNGSYTVIYGLRKIDGVSNPVPDLGDTVDILIPDVKILSNAISASVFGNAMMRVGIDSVMSIEIITPDGGWIRNHSSDSALLVSGVIEIQLLKAMLSFVKSGKGSFDMDNSNCISIVIDGIRLCVSCTVIGDA